MTAPAIARSRAAPAALGLGTLMIAVLAVEVLIRAGVINRFIVPLPSQVALAFGRVITEEDLGERFRLTFLEAFTAGVMITVVGVGARHPALSREPAAPGDRNLVAALASAPTVLMYPLFLVTSAATPGPSSGWGSSPACRR